MSEATGAGRAIRRIGGDIAEIYRRGGRTLVAAPLLAAIASVPEAIQHVVEIRLGMFASMPAFRALSGDPTRWAFGYVKVAGFMIAILAIARFHATGSVRRALLPRPAVLVRTAATIAAGFALAWPFGWLQSHTDAVILDGALGAVSAVIQAAMMLLIVAALVEDDTLTWRAAFTSRLPSAVLLTLYAAIAFLPCQALHMANHKLALGRPPAMVWTLMAWDSLWVGLFAALVGSALFVASRARLTWRGWVA